MQNVVFDRISRQIKRINTEETLPFERSIQLPFPITLSKQISIPTNQLIQKTNSEGLPLYKENITINPETNEESYTETLSHQTPTQFETQTIEYKIATDQFTTELVDEIQPDGSVLQIEVQIPIYTTITNTIQFPTSFQENLPILIPEIIIRTVFLENEYLHFTAYEVTDAKIRSITANSLTPVVYFNEEMSVDGFDLINCSSGNGFLIMHKNSETITHIIQLFTTTDTVRIYIESQPDIEVYGSLDNNNFIKMYKNRIKFDTPTTSVNIKLVNTSINNREVYCLGVLS